MKTIVVTKDEIRSIPQDGWASFVVASVGGSDDVYVYDGEDLMGMYNDRVKTSYDRPPVPTTQFDWSATFDDYDGAPDSPNRDMVGHGATRNEAIANLHEKAGTTLLDLLEWSTKDLSGNAHDILCVRDGKIRKVKITE